MSAVVVELGSLGERLADPHHDTPVDLTVCTELVQDHSAVVCGGDLEHAHDPRAAVDLHARGMRDQLRRMERLEAEAADASLGGSFRPGGELAGTLAVERAAAGELRDRD